MTEGNTVFGMRNVPEDSIMVDESVVRTACAACGPGSVFEKALNLGQQYKDLGFTPIFMTNNTYKMIYVTFLEGFNETFH
jgi:hypothetical protein